MSDAGNRADQLLLVLLLLLCLLLCARLMLQSTGVMVTAVGAAGAAAHAALPGAGAWPAWCVGCFCFIHTFIHATCLQ
jgi:hypothetical protein